MVVYYNEHDWFVSSTGPDLEVFPNIATLTVKLFCSNSNNAYTYSCAKQ